MNHLLTLKTPLQNVFWQKERSLFTQALLLIAGVTVLAFASQLSIPLRPVPLTFQSATVILIGMAYGPRHGVMVILAYLAAGLCGLPVFADFSAGPAIFLGPTAGYLLGFLPAAFLSGYLAQKGFAKNILKNFIGACLGASLIFICGLSYLAHLIGWHQAVLLGLMPFLISEPIKLLAVSTVARTFWK